MMVASTLTMANPLLPQLLDHRTHEPAAVGAAQTRVGIRKMPADVAQPRRTEQRVADRVQQHVAIGMAEQTLLERDVDAADHQLAPRHQRVDVEPLSDSES